MPVYSQDANNWGQTPRTGDGGNVAVGIATAYQSVDANYVACGASKPNGGLTQADGCPVPTITPIFPAFSIPIGEVPVLVEMDITHKQGNIVGGGTLIFEYDNSTVPTGGATVTMVLSPSGYTVAYLNAGNAAGGALNYHGVGSIPLPTVNGFAQMYGSKATLRVTTQATVPLPPNDGFNVDGMTRIIPLGF